MKTQFTDVFLKMANQPPKVRWVEMEMKRNFENFHKLVTWLRDDNWDGKTFVCPMPPQMSNGSFSRAHWRDKSELMNQYKGFMQALQCCGLMPKAPRDPPNIARISMHLYVWSLMDKSGAMAREKWPVDWLVTSGYLVNDNDEHLVWDGLPQQTVTRKEPQRIEFRITPSLCPTSGRI